MQMMATDCRMPSPHKCTARPLLSMTTLMLGRVLALLSSASMMAFGNLHLHLICYRDASIFTTHSYHMILQGARCCQQLFMRETTHCTSYLRQHNLLQVLHDQPALFIINYTAATWHCCRRATPTLSHQIMSPTLFSYSLQHRVGQLHGSSICTSW